MSHLKKTGITFQKTGITIKNRYHLKTGVTIKKSVITFLIADTHFMHFVLENSDQHGL